MRKRLKRTLVDIVMGPIALLDSLPGFFAIWIFKGALDRADEEKRRKKHEGLGNRRAEGEATVKAEKA